MPPGTDIALKTASERGYEAVIVVLIMGAMLFFFGLLGRWFINSTDKRLEEATKREDRLANRITVLEDFAHTTLVQLVRDVTVMMTKNNEAIDALTSALNKKLCILDPSRQDDVISKVAQGVAREVRELNQQKEG